MDMDIPKESFATAYQLGLLSAPGVDLICLIQNPSTHCKLPSLGLDSRGCTPDLLRVTAEPPQPCAV